MYSPSTVVCNFENGLIISFQSARSAGTASQGPACRYTFYAAKWLPKETRGSTQESHLRRQLDLGGTAMFETHVEADEMMSWPMMLKLCKSATH